MTGMLQMDGCMPLSKQRDAAGSYLRSATAITVVVASSKDIDLCLIADDVLIKVAH